MGGGVAPAFPAAPAELDDAGAFSPPDVVAPKLAAAERGAGEMPPGGFDAGCSLASEAFAGTKEMFWPAGSDASASDGGAVAVLRLAESAAAERDALGLGFREPAAVRAACSSAAPA